MSTPSKDSSESLDSANITDDDCKSTIIDNDSCCDTWSESDEGEAVNNDTTNDTGNDVSGQSALYQLFGIDSHGLDNLNISSFTEMFDLIKTCFIGQDNNQENEDRILNVPNRYTIIYDHSQRDVGELLSILLADTQVVLWHSGVDNITELFTKHCDHPSPIVVVVGSLLSSDEMTLLNQIDGIETIFAINGNLIDPIPDPDNDVVVNTEPSILTDTNVPQTESTITDVPLTEDTTTTLDSEGFTKIITIGCYNIVQALFPTLSGTGLFLLDLYCWPLFKYDRLLYKTNLFKHPGPTKAQLYQYIELGRQAVGMKIADYKSLLLTIHGMDYITNLIGYGYGITLDRKQQQWRELFDGITNDSLQDVMVVDVGDCVIYYVVKNKLESAVVDGVIRSILQEKSRTNDKIVILQVGMDEPVDNQSNQTDTWISNTLYIYNETAIQYPPWLMQIAIPMYNPITDSKLNYKYNYNTILNPSIPHH